MGIGGYGTSVPVYQHPHGGACAVPSGVSIHRRFPSLFLVDEGRSKEMNKELLLPISALFDILKFHRLGRASCPPPKILPLARQLAQTPAAQKNMAPTLPVQKRNQVLIHCT